MRAMNSASCNRIITEKKKERDIRNFKMRRMAAAPFLHKNPVTI